MRRAIWSGVITFGIVSIPVKMYSATQSNDISFHLLHGKCDSRIKEYKWCPHCDRKIEWNDIDKGYEYAKGKCVKLTSDDFEKLPLPSKHTIEITSFVQTEEIDPIYYEKTYFLEPDKSGEKPFVLLMKVIEERGLVAIGTVAMRRERLCALRLMDGHLMVDTLLYPDEIRVDSEEKKPSARIQKSELEMASKLVDMMVKPFDPSEYKDGYREALKKLIHMKLKGKEISEVEEEPQSGKVIDLMDALRASLDSARTSMISKTATKESTKTKTTANKTRKTKPTAARKTRKRKTAHKAAS